MPLELREWTVKRRLRAAILALRLLEELLIEKERKQLFFCYIIKTHLLSHLLLKTRWKILSICSLERCPRVGK